MPLTKSERTAISDEIRKTLSEAIEDLRPKGVRKVLHFLREWGLAATAVVAPLTLLGILVTTLIYTFGEAKKNGEFQGHTASQLEQLGKDVANLKSQLAAIHLSGFAQLPINEISARDVLSAVDDAQQTRARIDPKIIRQLSDRVLAGSDGKDSRWHAALKLASYASSLRTSPTNDAGVPLSSYHTHYVAPDFRADVTPQAYAIGNVPANEAAILHLFNGPDMNAESTTGPAYLLIRGGTLRIDDRVYRHVIMQDAHIEWQGGPIKMEDVWFIHCTFDVPSAARGKQLLAAVSTPDGTNYSSDLSAKAEEKHS